jgi:hypothetical protein
MAVDYPKFKILVIFSSYQGMTGLYVSDSPGIFF